MYVVFVMLLASKRFKKTIGYARRLRQTMTQPELLLWKTLRGRRFRGWKFRRQVPIGPFIVDFFCAEQKLIIEIDGSVHAFKLRSDMKRQEFLERAGYRVLRFLNVEVLCSLEWVLSCIERVVQGEQKQEHSFSRPAGEGEVEG